MKRKVAWIPLSLLLPFLAGAAACRITPSEAERARREATKASEEGKWVEAGELWLQIHLAAGGTNVEAARELARALAEQGDRESSTQVIEASLAANPTSAELLGYRVELTAAAGEPREVAAAIEAWLAVEPDNPDAWRELGELWIRVDDLPRASAALLRAASFPPEDPELLLLLAEVSERAGDTRVALNARMRALQSGIVTARQYEDAGRLAAERVLNGEEPELAALADEWLRQAAELDPQSVQARWYLGRLERRRHLPREAIGHLRRVVELEPTHWGALGELAEIHAQEGEAGPAREYAERALALDPPAEIRERLSAWAQPPPESE